MVDFSGYQSFREYILKLFYKNYATKINVESDGELIYYSV